MSESPRPWYLRAFVVVCAWFTALFFLVWIGILFNHSEEGMAFLGVLLLVGSSLIGRVVKDSDFLDHANLACALAGRVMVFMGFPGSFDDLATKAGVMTLAEPLWFALNPNSTYRFISACSAYLFMGLWLDEIEGGAQTWLPLVVAGALVPFVFALRPAWGGDRWDGVWRPLGWASVLVLSLWSVVGGDWLVAGKSPLDVYAASGMLTLLLLCLVGWLLKDRLGDALVVLPVLIALAWAMKGNPSVMGGLLLGLVGFRSREHKITAMAAATLLAGVVSYYYRLNETLLYKSGVMAISGVLFAGVAVWFSRNGKGRSVSTGKKAFGRGNIRALAALLVLVATSVMVDLSAVTAEGKKTTGEEVYLQLRPRDPRDPLLGDYMAVNFKVCNDIIAAYHGRPGLSPAGQAWVRRDEKRILWFDSLDDGVEKPGLLRIRYSVSEGQVSIGTTKVYFQEGDEPRFRNARYGRFKLQNDGTLTWLGFTDENLKDL